MRGSAFLSGDAATEIYRRRLDAVEARVARGCQNTDPV